MEKIRMHKKMAMTGKDPTAGTKIGDTKDFIKRRKILAGGKMGGGMMKPTGYKMGGGVKKPVTVKEITPKGRKGVLIYKGKAKDYKPVGKMGGGMMKPKKAVLGALIAKKMKK